MLAIDLNRIHDFIKIVDLGNITRAAEAMNDRKAKLSRNLALLEKELGVQLVYRTTRQFKLTDPGIKFYQQMKMHFSQLEGSLAELMKQDKEIEGKIRLTAPEDLGHQIITPIINEFCILHPRIDFEIIYTNQLLDLIMNQVDVAFRIGQLSDSSLIQQKVGQVELVAAASPSYLEKVGEVLQPEELQHHATIGFLIKEKCVWNLYSKTNKKSLKIKPKVIANNYLTVKDLTVLGRGISFLPRFLIQENLDKGTLVHILRPWRNEGAPVQIVMPGQKNIALRLRSFFDFSSKRLREII